MIGRAGVAAAIIAVTFLTYFKCPGHTYLQQDTQIYVPILEHLWDASVLNQDILVQRPHLAFTLYDEVALALRWMTGADFRSILAVLQIVTRALGLWGVFLIALAILHDRRLSLLVMAIAGLGGAIDGPAVLITEYEPSPRAFAIPLVFLAIGLMAWRRPIWAATAAAFGFVLHPPSVLAFWALYFLLERRLKAWAPFAIAVAVLLLAAAAQPGVKESQPFFSQITPELERLQRMRASYNWVSMWWTSEWWKHILAATVVTTGLWRLRKLGSAGTFLIGLPLLGMISVPLSYLLLEKLKWGLIPQLQPARTLLFVLAMAVLLAGICGCLAVKRQSWVEAASWFFVTMVPPLMWNHWWLAAALAGLLLLGAKYRWASAPAVVASFFAIPLLAHVVNYPVVHTPQLRALSQWAAQKSAKDAVFIFAGAGKKPDAGVFRAEALRAIYVDWKGGGQVNYLPQLGQEWWGRWENVMLQPIDFDKYRRLGIDYAVLPSGKVLPGQTPAFENSLYRVYSVLAKTP